MTADPRPFDPHCKRRPSEIPEIIEKANELDLHPDDFVRLEEGTYNPENGHFLCMTCYIAEGSPSGTWPHRWRCP